MSSKVNYAFLFTVAALSLSGWSPSSSAATSCSRVGQELSKGKNDVACAVEATKDTQAVRTDVRVTKQGEGDQTNYVVDFTTEANCNPCKIRAQQTTDQLIINTDDINDLQNQIQSKLSRMESQAFDSLTEEANKKQAIENCRIDKSGNKLDSDEKLACRIERLENIDDEKDAAKYFNKHIKKALEEQAFSSDPDVRAEALEKLEEIKGMELSESLNQKISLITMSSNEMSNVETIKQKATTQLLIASQLPENDPRKQAMVQSAQQMLEQKQAQLQNTKIQMMMSQSNGGSASMIQDMNTYFGKAESSLAQVYNSSPDLQKAKADTLANGTNNNLGRLARGGTQVQLQQQIPQLANPTGIPPAGVIPMGNSGFNGINTGLGRGTTGSRIPGPQFMQNQTFQNYNSTYPMGNQFQQAPQFLSPM